MPIPAVASSPTNARPKELDDEVVINGEIENFANDIFPLIGETNALNNSAQSLRLAANNTAVLKAEGNNTHQKVDAQIKSSVNPFSKPMALQSTYQFGPREDVLKCLYAQPLTNDPKLIARGILRDVASDVAGKTSDYIGMELSATSALRESKRLDRFYGRAPIHPEDAVICGITEALVNCSIKEPSAGQSNKPAFRFDSEDHLLTCFRKNPVAQDTYLIVKQIPEKVASELAHQTLDSADQVELVTKFTAWKNGAVGPIVDPLMKKVSEVFVDCAEKIPQ